MSDGDHNCYCSWDPKSLGFVRKISLARSKSALLLKPAPSTATRRRLAGLVARRLQSCPSHMNCST